MGWFIAFALVVLLAGMALMVMLAGAAVAVAVLAIWGLMELSALIYRAHERKAEHSKPKV